VVCPTRSTCIQHPIHFHFFIINMYAESTSHEAFSYAVLYKLLLLYPPYIQIILSASCSRMPLVYVFFSQCDRSSITLMQTNIIIKYLIIQLMHSIIWIVGLLKTH
jgi:hypothetical protein